MCFEAQVGILPTGVYGQSFCVADAHNWWPCVGMRLRAYESTCCAAGYFGRRRDASVSGRVLLSGSAVKEWQAGVFDIAFPL